MTQNESQSNELDERLKSLIDMIDAKSGEIADVLSSSDIVSFYLHPNEKINLFREQVGSAMDEISFSKSDYFTIAKLKPEYSDICLWALDHIEGIDDEVIFSAFELGKIGPMLSNAEKIPELTSGKVSISDLYNLVLEYRSNRQRTATSDFGSPVINSWEDSLILSSWYKFPGKTFDSVKDDLEQSGSVTFDLYFNHLIDIARKSETLADLGEFRSLYIKQYPDLFIHHLNIIKDVSKEDIDFVSEHAQNFFGNLEQLEGIVSPKIIQERFAAMDAQARNDTVLAMLGVGRYSAIDFLFDSIDPQQFAQEKQDVINILTNGYYKRLKTSEMEYRNVEIVSGYIQNLKLGNYTECTLQRDCLFKLDHKAVAELDPIPDVALIESADKKIHIEKYLETQVTSEAMRFYLYEWADYKLMLLKGRTPTLQILADDESLGRRRFNQYDEFSNLSDTIKLHELESTVTESRKLQIENSFDWMRKYLIVAINSEITHQRVNDQLSSDYLKGIDIFTANFTQEEIRQFLEKARYTLYKATDFKIAGYPWMVLAKIGVQCWGENSNPLWNKAAFVDQIFDAEHNNGNIFDKDPDFIKAANLDLFLDVKFKATSEHDLLDYAENAGILDQSELDKFRTIFMDIAKLEKAPTRVAGYE